jgi:hypothetical protein
MSTMALDMISAFIRYTVGLLVCIAGSAITVNHLQALKVA